jgi:hypothetical protein
MTPRVERALDPHSRIPLNLGFAIGDVATVALIYRRALERGGGAALRG